MICCQLYVGCTVISKVFVLLACHICILLLINSERTVCGLLGLSFLAGDPNHALGNESNGS